MFDQSIKPDFLSLMESLHKVWPSDADLGRHTRSCEKPGSGGRRYGHRVVERIPPRALAQHQHHPLEDHVQPRDEPPVEVSIAVAFPYLIITVLGRPNCRCLNRLGSVKCTILWRNRSSWQTILQLRYQLPLCFRIQLVPFLAGQPAGSRTAWGRSSAPSSGGPG